jgi:hypothetical protein
MAGVSSGPASPGSPSDTVPCLLLTQDDADKYSSMLSEAYLVVLLYTVLSLMGKQEGDLEEDFQVGRRGEGMYRNRGPSIGGWSAASRCDDTARLSTAGISFIPVTPQQTMLHANHALAGSQDSHGRVCQAPAP